MRAIHKRIVTDDQMRPVAVQIDLREAEGNRTGGDEFEELLKRTEGTWDKEDGLEYQTKIREEWDDR